MKMRKNIFGKNICMRSKFSCVRSSHDLFVRAHSLEGTLVEGCSTFSRLFSSNQNVY